MIGHVFAVDWSEPRVKQINWKIFKYEMIFVPNIDSIQDDMLPAIFQRRTQYVRHNTDRIVTGHSSWMTVLPMIASHNITRHMSLMVMNGVMINDYDCRAHITGRWLKGLRHSGYDTCSMQPYEAKVVGYTSRVIRNETSLILATWPWSFIWVSVGYQKKVYHSNMDFWCRQVKVEVHIVWFSP